MITIMPLCVILSAFFQLTNSTVTNVIRVQVRGASLQYLPPENTSSSDTINKWSSWNNLETPPPARIIRGFTSHGVPAAVTAGSVV